MRHVALSTNQYAGHQIFKLKLQNNKNGYENLTPACERDVCRRQPLLEGEGESRPERDRAPTKDFNWVQWHVSDMCSRKMQSETADKGEIGANCSPTAHCLSSVQVCVCAVENAFWSYEYTYILLIFEIIKS